MSEDLYGVLGVSPQAEPEVIRAAYRSLIAKYHPDRNIGFSAEAEARAKQLNHAYAILIDPQKRSAYDRSRGAEKEHREAPEHKPSAPQPPKPPPPDSQPAHAPPGPQGSTWPIWLAIAVTAAIVGFGALNSPRPTSPGADYAPTPVQSGVSGPSVELSDLIWASMPDQGERITWNFRQFIPVAWETEFPTVFRDKVQRSGYLMVRVGGKVTERMDGTWKPVPWSITLLSDSVDDGVTAISIYNYGIDFDCLKYAPPYEMRNCRFATSDAIGSRIRARRLCSEPNGDFRIVRYLIQAEGKATSVAAFTVEADQENVASDVTVEVASPNAVSCTSD